MSCLKRPLDGQDPDYEDTIPNEAKRLRLLEKNGNYVIVISSSFKFLTVFFCFKSASDPINQKTLCEAKLNLRDTDTFISTEFVINQTFITPQCDATCAARSGYIGGVSYSTWSECHYFCYVSLDCLEGYIDRYVNWLSTDGMLLPYFYVW